MEKTLVFHSPRAAGIAGPAAVPGDLRAGLEAPPTQQPSEVGDDHAKVTRLHHDVAQARAAQIQQPARHQGREENVRLLLIAQADVGDVILRTVFGLDADDAQGVRARLVGGGEACCGGGR